MNPTDITTVAQETLNSLRQDLSNLDEILSILQEERSYLESTDHSQLDAFTHSKSKLSGLLDERAKARTQLLNSINLRCDNAQQWEATLSTFDKTIHGSDIRSTWAKVEDNLKLCDTATQVNGKIVASLLQSAKQFITALQGNDNNSGVYNADGLAATERRSEGFIQA